MGRLSRHRKIKSCDPFFKGQKDADTSSNMPVPASQLDNQPVPRTAQHLFKDGQKIMFIRKKRKGKPETAERKLQGKLDVQRKPGETQREYYQRLDKEAATEINKILVKERHVGQKRKEFLKARKERANKKRQIAIQEAEHKEFATDKVAFGEVVNEPPNFTARPRHATKLEVNKSRKMNSLLSQNKLNDQRRENEQIKTQMLPKSKKRKHMSAFEQQTSDRRRLEAIDSYRKLKKQSIEENTR